MVITELYIKNFGKFKDYRLSLSEGLQIIEGENEFGKSTLYAFIKAMLFGMERGRGKAAKKDMYAKYEPWDYDGNYSGSIRFRCGERNFYLERRFDAYGKKNELVCEDDGEILSIEDGDLTMLLGGLTKRDFENTTMIEQLGVEPGQDYGSCLQEFGANFLETGSNNFEFQKAVDQLKEEEKELKKKKKILQQKKEEKRETIKIKMNFIWNDIARLEDKILELEGRTQEEKRVLAQNDKKEKKTKKVNQGINLLLFVCMAVSLFLFKRPFNAVIAVLFLLADIIYIWNCIKNRKLRKEEKEENEIFERRRSLLQHEEIKKRMFLKEKTEKQTLYGNLQEELLELDEISEEYKKLVKSEKAIALAKEKMESLADKIKENIGEILNQNVSSILSEITNQAYQKFSINEKQEMYVYGEGRWVEVQKVSRGTMEQVYFALRLATAELFMNEKMPLIMDETFVYYDNKRLKNTLNWLEKQEQQMILFTCSDREKRFLR